MAQENITLTVSEAEAALIKAQREKAEAERQEKEAKIKLAIAGRIEQMKKEAVQFSARESREEAAYRGFFNELEAGSPGTYIFKVTPCIKHFKAYDIEEYEARNLGRERIETASQDINYNDCKIIYKSNPDVTISVTNRDGAWRMEIHGLYGSDFYDKSWKTAKKIHEKIASYFDAKKAVANRAVAALNQQEVLWNILTAKFNNATVEKTKTYEESYDYGRHGRRQRIGNREIPTVTVTFSNGLQVIYTALKNNDVIESKVRTINYSKLNAEKIIEALANIQ